MGKRFIDTDIFEDTWFMELSISAKVLWMYCITKCDHAGILKWNERLVKFQTGIKEMPIIKEELKDRLVFLNEEYIFIPKFFKFQYPNYPQKVYGPSESAIKILREFGLINEETNDIDIESYHSMRRVIGESPDSPSKGKGKGKGNGEVRGVKGGGTQTLLKNSGVTLEDVIEAFAKTDDLVEADPKHYFNTALDWSNGSGKLKKDWIATIRNFARSDITNGRLKTKTSKITRSVYPDRVNRLKRTKTYTRRDKID